MGTVNPTVLVERIAMKRKHIFIVLLVAGVVLLCSSIALTIISAANKNIIGGAGVSTLSFVFFHENKGLYSILAFCGAIAVFGAIVINILKKK